MRLLIKAYVFTTVVIPFLSRKRLLEDWKKLRKKRLILSRRPSISVAFFPKYAER